MPVVPSPVYGVTGSIDPLVPVRPIIVPRAVISEQEYEELEGSPEITIDEKQQTIVRTLICPWDGALLLAAKLKGYTRRVGNDWVVQPPHSFPYMPRSAVKSVRVSPFTSRPTADENFGPLYAKYGWAQLVVTYELADGGGSEGSSGDEDKPEEETYVSEELEPHAEFLTLPTNKFFWIDRATLPADDKASQIMDVEAPGKLIRSLTWVYTKHKMPRIPPFMFDFVGTVNEKEIISPTLGYIFAPETLLFDEPRLSRDITSEGVQAWKVTMRMIYRPWTWNKFHRSGKKDPEYIYKLNEFATPDKITQGMSVLNYLEIFKPYGLNDFSLVMGETSFPGFKPAPAPAPGP